MSWAFRIYRLLSAPGRNSLKFKRSSFGVYCINCLQANPFDGKSDGKISLGVLHLNFTVRRASGTRESQQNKWFPPRGFARLGKS
jgi:hypothetical protein